MNKAIVRELDLDGRKLKLETGVLAKQADAAVVASWGDTIILATVATKPLEQSLGYFPLSVEFVEKYYAGGRITGQRFIKRESRPSDMAVLTGRAIDRSIRPLFPKEFQNEVQIILSVLSYDGVADLLTLGLIATSAALSISSVPWNGPLALTRVGRTGDTVVLNPSLADLEALDLDVVVASGKEKIAMIEVEAKEVDDKLVFEAIKTAHEHSQQVIKLIEDFASDIKPEKQTFEVAAETLEESVLKEVKAKVKERIEAGLFDTKNPWHEATGDNIKSDLSKEYSEVLTSQMVSAIFDKVAKEIMNEAVLVKGKRVDGRKMDEVRPLSMMVGLLPRAHGSAVFQRGSTQVLAIATLGPLSLSQTLEGMQGESLKRFMHHYNMSINPFSTGEPKRLGSPNRRDIGHGALVEKGLVNVLPTEDEFPYAIRVVSEILGANASTSMASVCASTLAMLNAGVPLKNPVAGIALGLLSNEKKFQVITDMQATEDFYGEMDFKVTGSVKGVTAIQMDTKLQGLTFDIIEEALKQGQAARVSILNEMKEVMPAPGQISQYAPKIEVTHIKPEEIGMLIGPGGKNINAIIIARTGTQIDIEDDGTVMVSSVDDSAIKAALAEIEGMFKTVNSGEEYTGKVTKITTFGAFVEILPGKEGLVHISQMAPYRVEKVEDIVTEGQEVKVRVTDVTPEGKVGLSMLFGADIKPETERRPSGGGSRGGDRGPRRDFGGPRRDFGGGERRSGGFDRRSEGPREGGGERRPFDRRPSAPSSGAPRDRFDRRRR
jgi:polyribonucleotide nucleotidyltransferase